MLIVLLYQFVYLSWHQPETCSIGSQLLLAIAACVPVRLETNLVYSQQAHDGKRTR
jgi:hypothetical protein